ncbi:MAG: GC-type dockerin domain-anchored protein [Flavobacteriales bacterium]|nr:GC-type dockerin domain-anchored protein [Flavobacteriales bacterium]MDG1780981.1 GC-type dockerin domain-anchored protein [Flavobacteriales bacterium]MDG2246967.1 GC-type dockerin domain-anchored protein [Flavobacteriales bacterium]
MINVCPGDLTDDGMMDIDDVLFFLTNFGCTQDCELDLTGDGIVNTADLLVFLLLYSDGC